MKVGIWFYGVATAFTGILNIVWRDFDASHQPIQSLGKNIPGQHILACAPGILLIAAGLAIVWRRSAKIGAATSAIAYSAFALLWAARYYAGVHALGWRIDVLAGVSFGLAQQLMLLAPALMIYSSASSPDSLPQKRAYTAARWMLGLPPILFGLFHFIGIRVFATIVPHWMGFGYFWAGLSGMAFFLAGCAICSRIKDVLACRLLALMLLLFEVLVEIPPIFIRVHSQQTWGAAVYNLTAIGACWTFAEFLVSRTQGERSDPAEKASRAHSSQIFA